MAPTHWDGLGELNQNLWPRPVHACSQLNQKIALGKMENAGASQITPEEGERQCFDKSAGYEVPGILSHHIFPHEP